MCPAVGLVLASLCQCCVSVVMVTTGVSRVQYNIHYFESLNVKLVESKP